MLQQIARRRLLPLRSPDSLHIVIGVSGCSSLEIKQLIL